MTDALFGKGKGQPSTPGNTIHPLNKTQLALLCQGHRHPPDFIEVCKMFPTWNVEHPSCTVVRRDRRLRTAHSGLGMPHLEVCVCVSKCSMTAQFPITLPFEVLYQESASKEGSSWCDIYSPPSFYKNALGFQFPGQILAPPPTQQGTAWCQLMGGGKKLGWQRERKSETK